MIEQDGAVALAGIAHEFEKTLETSRTPLYQYACGLWTKLATRFRVGASASWSTIESKKDSHLVMDFNGDYHDSVKRRKCLYRPEGAVGN
jgi:hypothetical protein